MRVRHLQLSPYLLVPEQLLRKARAGIIRIMIEDPLLMSGIFESIIVDFLFDPVHLGETGTDVVHEPKAPQVLPSVYVAAEDGFGSIVVANDGCLENLLYSTFKGVITQPGNFVYRQPEKLDGDTVHSVPVFRRFIQGPGKRFDAAHDHQSSEPALFLLVAPFNQFARAEG